MPQPLVPASWRRWFLRFQNAPLEIYTSAYIADPLLESFRS
jgi:hypothetical protein